MNSFPVAAQDAVCAEVKIEIKQKVSLERQAFDAVLKINNGLTDQSIDNLQVTVNFTDAAGNSVIGTSDASNTTATFFIRVDTLTRVNAIDGTGSVAAKSSAEVRWLIIPSAGAGGTQPSGKRYSVGATISYKLGTALQTVNVTPEVITVKPQPRLALDYFLQQDVYADDPFTPAVEPSEPATLGVRIRNTGGGASIATKIETAQPKIAENRQGLLIAFQLINGYINDVSSGKTLLLDFGTIEPGTAKVGRWDLVTTLAGRFTEFSADFTHSDSLGGALTSLIDSVTTRFLLKDVKVDLPGRDSVRDFLSADGGLKVYESDGVDTAVIDVSGNAAIANAGGYSRLTHTSSSVLTYAKVADPNGGTVPLTSVTRSDGKVLDAANFWLSKKRNADLTWSYFVNIFDSNSTGSYTLGFSGGTTASLAGTVYDDQNKNGVRDAGEPGVGTTRVDLAGSEAATGSSVTATAYADANGNFSFANVKPGSYSLTVGTTAARVDGVAGLGNAGGTVVVGTGSTAAAITNIVLTAGANASGYLFAKVTPTTQPQPSADLSITVAPVSVVMNDQATSTLTYTVRNIGPDAASTVAVALSPSGTLRVNSASSSSGSFDSTSKRWTIGNLAKDSTATLSVVVAANASGSGSVSAAVSGTTQDPSSGNNSASTTFSVASTVPKADVRLVSFTPSLLLPAGKPGTVIFSAYNDGPDSAQALGIDLALPTQFSVTSIQPVGSSSGGFDAVTRRWTLPTLASGSAARLIVEGGFAATVADASNALFSAAITSSTSEDSNTSNNTTSILFNAAGRQADLRTTVTSVAGAPLSLATTEQGSVVFTVTNAGPDALSAADAAKLAVTVPLNLRIVSANADHGSYDSVSNVLSLPGLAVNESVNLTLVVTPTVAATPLTLTAVASAIVSDPTASNNVARVVINGAAVDADMRLSQTVDKALVQVGDEVVFNLQLTNMGAAIATDVSVRDRLPSGLNFVSASTLPATGAGSYDTVTGTWALPALGKDATASLFIRATVASAGAFTNAVAVTALQPDGNVANNTAVVTVTTNALPTVSIVSPVSGLVINAPASLTLSAAASDTDGSITKVEFFNGASLLGVGTLNASVYSFAWISAPAATYSVTAKATDNTGAVSVSAPVTIIVNALPTVIVTAPLVGAAFTAPAAVNLMATATDGDGTIATVEFFNGTTLIGVATRVGNVYALSWPTVAAGTYSVTAKATDDRGANTMSPPLTVVVQPPANQPPTVAMTSPVNGSVVNAPGTFVLTASASDVDGTIAKVEFYNGVTLLGAATLSSGSYGYTWANVPAGTYATISAVATDDKGATATSLPLTLVVNALPTVVVTAPGASASFTAPASISLEATASDSDGTISKLEFFNGGALIGVGAATFSAGSYRYLWNNVPSGNYSIVALATDDRAGSSTSTPVAIAVQAPVNQPPTVAFVAPTNNVVVNAPASVALSASAVDSDGSVTKVEFFNGPTLLGVGTLASGNYVYNWMNIPAGTYSSITAKATDDKGATATTASITIVVNAMPTISITAPAVGATFTAPATVGLVASASDSDGTIGKVEFFNSATLLGSGTLSGSGYTYNWTGVAIGSYVITAVATDNRSASTTSTARTVVVSVAANQPPTVVLVSPANNALDNAPGTFALTATAADSDGTVTKVEFFSGATLLGQGVLNSGNYVFNWTNVPAGTYANVTAKATDDKGSTTTTPAISLIVNALPVATLTAPTANATFVAPAAVNLIASATDADGSVSKVEFFNGASLIGVGALSGGSYRYSWTSVPVGSYSITARATDDRNATASSAAVSITVSSAANQPPTIAFTAPANNTVVVAPGAFALIATAADADGTISKVEFFNGATLLGAGAVTSGSYVYNWINVPAGTYSNVTAKATDDKGATATTAAVSLIVNSPPTVNLTSPSVGASFVAPATIGLIATASDSDGTISKVEFFSGSTLLGVGALNGGNYTYSWASVPAGSYAVTARATDNQGATSTTALRSVVVSASANQPPTVAFTAPANNAVVTAPGSFVLTATASDTDGTVSKVEFFNGATLLGTGTLSSGSYIYSWLGIPAGTYNNVTAKATDDKGSTATTAALSLVVNAPPVITLTAPIAGASFVAPATVSLVASASDSDGTLSKVEFFNGTALLGAGTLTGASYAYSWANVPAGTYAITARATDNRGATSSTAALAVVVSAAVNKPPTIAFTAPANNTLVTAPGSFALTATAADTDGTVSKVEFFNGATLLGLGTLASGSYVYNWANIAAGTYSNVTARATDDKGATATTVAVTLIVNASPVVTLTAPLANTSFTAPASIALSATDADGSIAKLEFYNGTALLGVGTLAGGVYSFNWSNVPSGSYAVTAKATDNRGASTSTPIRTVTVASCGTVSAFSFTSLDNVDLSTSVVSNPITVAGVACATPISVTGGDYSVNGGTFVSAAGSVKNGDVVRVRVTSAPDYLQSRSALLTIGGIVSNFAVTSVAKPTITQSQLRENRVLVFVACGATDNTNAQCLTTRKSYVARHLAGLGVESFVTSDAAEFERELRCGKYNTYWVSGGFEQLKGMIDDELAEAVYRGDGLLVDGVQDLRSDRIDLASGITYQGSLTNTNVSVFNTGNALDAGNYATVGRAAKLVLAGAQQQASFETANTTSAAKVAIATATYGAGKAMTIGFDWVASAQLATATPLLRADIAKALAFVLPALSDDQAAGSLVKLRTTVSNPAQIVSTVEVAATLPSTGQFVASNPVPSSVGGNIVRWRVDVNGQSSTKIDWSLRAPTTDSTTPISSTLSRVTGTGTSATLTAIGSAATQLTVGSYTTRSNAVRAQIAALSLTSLLEKAARDAALAYIDQAADEHARGKYDGGTRALIAANDSLDKITSVPTAVMQLQVSRMLKALAQEACANGVNPSACSTTGNFTNVSDFDYDGNDGTNVKLIRVRGGGTGSPTSGFGAGTWQVASLLKTANTQSQSTASFSYVSGRSYNWTFDYKGNGSVTFTLVDPTRQTASISTGSNWKVGNAIKLAVHADAGIGGGTVIESAVLALNGALLSGGVIATTGNNLISDISKVLSGPALTAPFKVTGTLKLTFTGSIPPTGDKLFFQITGGEGECE